MTKPVFFKNIFTKRVQFSTYLQKWCCFILGSIIYPLRVKTHLALPALIDLSTAVTTTLISTVARHLRLPPPVSTARHLQSSRSALFLSRSALISLIGQNYSLIWKNRLLVSFLGCFSETDCCDFWLNRVLFVSFYCRQNHAEMCRHLFERFHEHFQLKRGHFRAFLGDYRLDLEHFVVRLQTHLESSACQMDLVTFKIAITFLH